MNELEMIAKGIYHSSGEIGTFLAYSAAAASSLYVYSLLAKNRQIDGFYFQKYADSSFANPINTISGYKWATIPKLKSFTAKRNEIYIDNFRYDNDFTRKVKMPKFYKKMIEKTKIHFNADDMVEGLLICGKMKSGKSEIYNSILSQPWYDRAIIHSIKISFEKWGYNKNSIILNPYMEDSHIWDVMRESEGTIRTFFVNYLSSVLGNTDGKDFFSASAERIFNETMQTIKAHYVDEPSSKKWLLFIKAIKQILDESKKDSKKESKNTNLNEDVGGTMESIIEPLEIMAYEMQKKTKKTFIIADFFKMKNQAKLFLSNQTEYMEALDPLFSAFIASAARYHTTLPETKTDYTVYALDEYLNFADTIDPKTRKILHTLIRGFGGVMLPGVQYLPVDNKKLLLDLTSSAFAWIFFSTIEDETKDLLINKTEMEYSYKDAYEHRAYLESDKKDRDHTKTRDKKPLLSKNILDGLGAKFEHITYIPTHNLLYKGYTPQVELEERYSSFAQTDLSEFYKIKFPDTLKMTSEQIANLTFEDLYKDPADLPRSEKYRLFNLHKNSNDKDQFKQENNLVNVDLDLLFKDFTQDDQILDNQMQLLSIDERFELFTEWSNIADDDFNTKYDFIEKHNLFGALPGLFQFEDEFINDL